MSPCCSEKLVRCRICHNSEHYDHEFDRFSVQNVCCNRCQTIQPAADKCNTCSLLFGTYYCAVCRLYDYNDKTRPYYHCFDCGICRVGSLNNSFHCHTCGICFSLEEKKSHQCVEGLRYKDCPVCLQSIFDSRGMSFVILPCRHPIHVECGNAWIRRSPECPLCRYPVLQHKKAI